jgi:hypothetical protein
VEVGVLIGVGDDGHRERVLRVTTHRASHQTRYPKPAAFRILLRGFLGGNIFISPLMLNSIGKTMVVIKL